MLWSSGRQQKQHSYLDEVSRHCDDAGRQGFPEQATQNIQEFGQALRILGSITATNIITPQDGTQALNSYPQNIPLFFLLGKKLKKKKSLFFKCQEEYNF